MCFLFPTDLKVFTPKMFYVFKDFFKKDNEIVFTIHQYSKLNDRYNISYLIHVKFSTVLCQFFKIRFVICGLAYDNGLVLPHSDYADFIWGDQPGLKYEMVQLQGFQNKFAKKVFRKNRPLEYRRRAHRCLLVQNSIKGNVPEHFDSFKSPLNSHGYNTRNGYLPRFGKFRTTLGKLNVIPVFKQLMNE